MKNLRIGTRLRIGLGLLLLFVILLGTTAYYQVDSIWRETRGLHDHPMKVGRAIGDLRADVFAMQNGMQDLVFAGSTSDRLQIEQRIDSREADALQQFAILFDRYLGPRKDIEEAYNRFIDWKAIRGGVLRLLNVERVVEASAMVRSTGLCGVQMENVLKEIQDIGDFASNRSDKFFHDAEVHKDLTSTHLWILLGAILLLSFGVSFFLHKGIRDPLKELTSVTRSFGQGNLDARCRFVSANEFGILADSFNRLAEVIQAQMQSRESVAEIADVMLAEEELRPFCRALLQYLIEHTGSQVGAIYLRNEEKTDFAHFESIGLSGGGRTSFSASTYEGEFGAALATRRIQHIKEIPADTRHVFSTVTGDLTPGEIVTIPVLLHQEVVAMISLASVRGYTSSAVRLVHDVWNVLTARMNGVLAFRKIREFSERLESQNSELEEQSRELAVQRDELTEQNVELEMQKRQLDEVNRLKSVFLSNMSHELRTPLNSIIALSGVLSRRLPGVIPEEEYSYLEVIQRNGKLLLSLINDILDLSRIEAGREEISLSRFSVDELVHEVVSMIEPQAREKGFPLSHRISGDHLQLASDFSKCRHILQNIVGNAVKFTSEGKVEISAQQFDHGILIAVSDTGIGITDDQLPHIFDEFRQADESTSRRYGGSGLGLAIARRYTTLLGGTITVTSTPGKGSTFTVVLPLTMVQPASGEQMTVSVQHTGRGGSNEPLSPRSGHGKSILLVEDSEPAMIQIRDILTEQGYLVRAARNGSEALEQIEEAVPDAMILDLMMPEVDGFQVLMAIRGMERTARLPVLVLTAKHITKDDFKFLKGNGIHQLIQKGDVGKKELLATVEKMVSPTPDNPAPAPRKPIRATAAGKPLILVVEDNPDNLMTVKALLQDTCSLVEAVDGPSGIQQARTHKPHLILLDISLPGLDGFQVLEEIRNEERLRHIPVIALTARAMKGDREEILDRGFDGYITKPLDEGVLKKTIEDVLHAR